MLMKNCEHAMADIFEERERGYEAKWGHDEEQHFKIMSLRNARLAHWAGKLMTLPADQLDQYAQTVLAVGLSDQKNESVFAKIKKRSRGALCHMPRFNPAGKDERALRASSKRTGVLLTLPPFLLRGRQPR
jgi:hypothetical protein